MDKIKVSILVPAYHVEAYLDECLQSLLSQTLKEIEIVVVDDGSSDRTATIAEQYAASDSRIRVIRLPEHQGVSHARNACLAEAQGEYLSFVDSDDTISSTAMEELYHKAKTTDADIVLGSMLYCYPDGRQVRVGDKSPVFRSDNEILSGQECFIRMQQTGCYVPMVCSNLYRTAFIKAHPQLHFEGEFHEDEYFTPFTLYEATRVTDFKKDFYLYRQRPDSIMHKDNNVSLRVEALKGVINTLNTFATNICSIFFKEALLKNISRLSQTTNNITGHPQIDRNKKQLLLFTRKNCASRYGVGTYIKQLATSLDQSIWHVYIVELYASGTECSWTKEDGIHYIHIPDTTTGKNDAEERFQKSVFYWIATHYSGVKLYCHFNFTADKVLATLLKEKLDAYIVFTLHYMEWKFYLNGKDERSLSRVLSSPQSAREKELVLSFQQERDFIKQCCDSIITVSQHSCQLLQDVYGIDNSRITCIPHGLCNTYRERSKQELDDIRNKYHLSANERIILYVGRLSDDKGLHLLIAAFKLLLKEHEDVRLVIAGSGNYEHFMKMANPLWNKIIFTGYLCKEQLEELYALSTVGVIPSFHEELGYVAIEMFMHKLPVVCSDASGLKEVTDNGECAVMIRDWCKTLQLFPLKAALEKVLSDISYQEELKEKGRSKYLRDYSLNMYQKKIGLFYQ